MQTQNSINEMLAMQNALNDMTNGAGWRNGKTALGKVIDWRRCIIMETAELIDSYPWKHWKAVDAQIDIENARVELVDIWHFLLSLALENFELEKAAGLLNNALILSQQSQKITRELTTIEQVKIHETMMRIALESVQVSESYLSALTKAFFNACKVADLDFDSLYQIYMAKNVLNKFRQDHGYKEGTYLKEWNGKEDNVVMFEIIAKMSIFSGDELYISLKETYSQLS
jgi:dimeric dUTPase (all-alpha-NTP-PPase superfamily)